jgi:hypothetical protein
VKLSTTKQKEPFFYVSKTSKARPQSSLDMLLLVAAIFEDFSCHCIKSRQKSIKSEIKEARELLEHRLPNKSHTDWIRMAI